MSKKQAFLYKIITQEQVFVRMDSFGIKNSHPEESGWPLTIACHMKKSYLAAEEGAASVEAGAEVSVVPDAEVSVVLEAEVSVVAGVEVSVVPSFDSLLQAVNAAAIINT